MFRKITPRRPTVIRVGNRVKTCYLYNEMRECLGAQCFWPKAGTCPTYTRLAWKAKRAK